MRRLVIDGVDLPLADLFVHAARQAIPTDEGVAQARSATEAFLYRRLQTLPGTDGRFRLNAMLPFPFDESGNMEVDLLDPKARLAVELDGPQHLADLDAYRRDRRKDALLQENGYFVLRFLAEDVGKRLDHVLDTIIRVLAFRDRSLLSTSARAENQAGSGCGVKRGSPLPDESIHISTYPDICISNIRPPKNISGQD